MVLGRTHRAQMNFPVHFTAPDRSKTYIGETIDIASTGFSVQVKTDDPLPAIILAGILPTEVAGDAILCKARMVWHGGLANGVGRASYKIISIAQKSQDRLDQLIQKSLGDLMDDLQECPAFQDTPRSDLEILLGLARTRALPAGHTLYQTGQTDNLGIYIILGGKVTLESPAGTPAGLGRGAVFGCWIGSPPVQHRQTAVASAETRLLYVPLPAVTDLSRRASGLAQGLRDALGQPVAESADEAGGPRRHRMRVTMPRELHEIPTLPSVFNAVMDCIEDAEATPRDLAAILRKDQSLTAKVLKTVNSALYGFARQISAVNDAVVLLGMRQTANLAITAMLLNTLTDTSQPGRRPEQFWEHALGVGYFAQAIGRRLSATSFPPASAAAAPARRGEAGARTPATSGAAAPRTAVHGTGTIPSLDRLFTYAILHDIGLVVLFLHFPDHFALVRDAIPKCGSLHQAELDLLELDHCQLGYRVTKAWRLPEPIPTICAEHHLPQVWASEIHDRDELLGLLREEPAVTLISVADLMARHTRIGTEMDPQPPEIPPVLYEALGLNADAIGEILAEGPEIEEKTRAFFRGLNG